MEPARILARRKGRSIVTAEDVREASKYFVDVQESLEYIRKFESMLLR